MIEQRRVDSSLAMVRLVKSTLKRFLGICMAVPRAVLAEGEWHMSKEMVVPVIGECLLEQLGTDDFRAQKY